MKKINSWKSKNKNQDRFEIKIRFGFLTVLEVFYDMSDNKLRLMIFNLGIEIGK